MSWIHNHTRHYIVPGLFAIAAAHRKLNPDQRFWSMQDVNVVDRPRTVRNIRPARGPKTKELGMIWAALTSIGYDQYLSSTMKHDLWMMPSPAEEKTHTIVKNSFRALRRILRKNPRRKLILPGRDVWLWSVMCHKKGIDHIFDPRISRMVARDSVALKRIVNMWKLNKHTIIFDTGFAGSIYERICAVSKQRCINLMLSTGRDGEQIFPNHKGARGKALGIEYLPKYQKTGTVRREAAVQWLAPIDGFLRAAILTIWFWYHESPAWINQGGERCRVVDCYCRSCKLWKDVSVPG